MAITGRDIERLLYTDTPDPILVVHNDTPEIVAAAELGGYTGAVVVCSRSEILRQVGERDLSEEDLAAMSASLTAAIQDPTRPRPLWPA
ncbi:NYN domain-containing protein [Lentzea kentuckyensis]|uniref:NYN domain-containing protein n=1 Tax=Lentzea kentuckyensis TaxID=360086 RepID=UPI00117A04AA|nr:NYN domain-containing protein [Lentzea kentuckyensis]